MSVGLDEDVPDNFQPCDCPGMWTEKRAPNGDIWPHCHPCDEEGTVKFYDVPDERWVAYACEECAIWHQQHNTAKWRKV